MKPTTSPYPLRWLAWGLCALAGLTLTADVVVILASGLTPVTAFTTLYVIPIFAYSLLGALIITYRSENRIGWLLLAGGPLLALGILANDVLKYGYTVMAAPPAASSPPAGGVWPGARPA